MPRIWGATIEAHRTTVREAVVEAAARLVAEHGLRGVTMSAIAETSGIGRATLYKYFPDVESILAAWHERQISVHLAQLAEVRDRTHVSPGARLQAVLERYATLVSQMPQHGNDAASALHADGRVAGAEAELTAMVTELIADAAAAGEVRDDVDARELAGFCLHAIAAARRLPSRAAVRRLVAVTLDGLRPGHPGK